LIVDIVCPASGRGISGGAVCGVHSVHRPDLPTTPEGPSEVAEPGVPLATDVTAA